jgi:hypothetical protein
MHTRLRILSRWLGMAMLVGACERPTFSLGAAVHLPANAVGHPMLVLEYDSATWDQIHLPVLGPGWGEHVLLATVATQPDMAASNDGTHCPPALYVAAWVDVSESTGLRALVAGRTLTPQSFRDDRTLEGTFEQLVQLVPLRGDVLGAGGPLDFGPENGTCGHPRLTIDVPVTVTVP